MNRSAGELRQAFVPQGKVIGLVLAAALAVASCSGDSSAPGGDEASPIEANNILSEEPGSEERPVEPGTWALMTQGSLPIAADGEDPGPDSVDFEMRIASITEGDLSRASNPAMFTADGPFYIVDIEGRSDFDEALDIYFTVTLGAPDHPYNFQQGVGVPCAGETVGESGLVITPGETATMQVCVGLTEGREPDDSLEQAMLLEAGSFGGAIYYSIP